MNKFHVDKDKCKGCGLCVKQCGISSIVSVNRGKAEYNQETENCRECFHCFKICPNNAISYNDKNNNSKGS